MHIEIPARRRRSKGDSKSITTLLFVLLSVILIWLPLPAGSKPVWAASVLILLVALISTLWCVAYAFGQVSSSKAFTKAWPVHSGFIVVTFWVWFQGLMLPSGWVESLSPNAYFLQQAASEVLPAAQSGSVSISMGSHETIHTFLLTLSYYLLFCLVLLLVTNQRRVQQLLWVMILSGCFQALFGSLSTLSGAETLLFAEKEVYRGVATGTFVNRNSFAGYLEMTLALGVGLLVARLSSQSASGWQERLRQWLDTLMSNKILLRSALAIMVIGLVMSRSRMGNTAFFSSLLVSGLLYIILRKQLTRGMAFLFGSMILIDAVIVSQWFGIEKVVERIEQTSLDHETRPDVSLVSLDIIKDYPLTGTGGGTFYTALPNYHDGNWKGFYDLAHNDFLQFPLEFGLPAFAVLALMVLMAFWQAAAAIKVRKNRLMSGSGFASLMGMLAIMIHSSVDFNLQIPANATLFVCLMALAYVARYGPGRQQKQSI